MHRMCSRSFALNTRDVYLVGGRHSNYSGSCYTWSYSMDSSTVGKRKSLDTWCCFWRYPGVLSPREEPTAKLFDATADPRGLAAEAGTNRPISGAGNTCQSREAASITKSREIVIFRSRAPIDLPQITIELESVWHPIPINRQDIVLVKHKHVHSIILYFLKENNLAYI